MVSSRTRRSNVEAQKLGGEIYRSTHNEGSTTAKISSWPSGLGDAFRFRRPYLILSRESICRPCVFWAALLFFRGPYLSKATEISPAHSYFGLRFFFRGHRVMGRRKVSSLRSGLGHGIVFRGPIAFWATKFWPSNFLHSLHLCCFTAHKLWFFLGNAFLFVALRQSHIFPDA